MSDEDRFITQNTIKHLESDENVESLHDILTGEGELEQPNDVPSGFALTLQNKTCSAATVLSYPCINHW
jgi:hypothetical protein